MNIERGVNMRLIKPCKIKIDLYDTFCEQVPEYTQYDRNIPLEVTVMDKGEEIDITGWNARIGVSKPDGTRIYREDLTVEGNKITTKLTDQVFAVAGMVEIAIDLVDEESTKVSLHRFYINVKPSVITDEVIKSSNDYQTIVNLIKEVRDIEDTFEQEQQNRAEAFEIETSNRAEEWRNEVDRFTSEFNQQMESQRNKFQQGELSRAESFDQQMESQQVTFEAIEQERDQAEKTRKQQEQSRQIAEEQRGVTEEQRRSAEQERNSKERERKQAELSRNDAEVQRKQDENIRKVSEDERKVNEVNRQSAEEQRVTAEENRKNAENDRVNKENQRQSAEQVRSSEESKRQADEKQRKVKEQERQSAEQERQAKEQERLTKELERQAKEQERVDAEVGRDQRMTEFTERAEQMATDIETQTQRIEEYVNTNEERLLSHRDKIDYWGDHHTNMKDTLDTTVDRILGDFNTLNHTGEYITATETIARHVPRGTLKGHTEVNCIQEPSGADIILPYDFEPGYDVTINDTKETGAIGIELQGQTLVNLAINGSNKIYRGVNSTTKLAYTIQANKLYYLVVHVKSNTLNKPFRFSGYTLGKNATKMPESDIGGDKDIFDIGEVGKKRFKVGYTEIVENAGTDLIMFAQNTDTLEGSATYDIMLLEYQEGMEDWDIPYFEGMTSVQAPTVKTCGKNLFYGEVINNKDIHGSTGLVIGGNRTTPVNFIPVKPKTTYTLTRPVSSGNAGIRYYSKNQNYLSTTSFVPANGIATFTFTTPIGCYFLKFVDEANTLNSNYQIEEGSTATTYERHQSSLLTLPEEIVLRGLPNGVCDTYNTKTKEYTQRIGEIVLDGSEDEEWRYNEGGSIQGKKCFSLPWELTPNRKQYGYAICDHMPITTTLDKVGVYNGQGLNILIDSNSNDVGVLKEILASKPITVQYELAEPIVTKIDLPSLKAYNTVTHLSSTTGEGSLVPMLASDNTISYPTILKPNTKYSIIANPTLNNHTSTPISCNLGGTSIEILPDSGNCHLITTPSNLAHSNLTFTDGDGHKLCGGVMLLEGDKTGMMLNYFEGMKSVENPIVKVTNGLDELTESYKSNTLTIPTQLSLRSLPNGVCDTLDLITGEYVQNVGEHRVQGTEPSWFTIIDTTGEGNNYLNQTSCAFGFHLIGKAIGNAILCDKFPTERIGLWGAGFTREGVCGIDGDNRIFFRINNEKTGVLYTDNVKTATEKAKTYFTNNPATVQYELETPIVKQLDLHWEDDKLFAYDGTTHFLVDIEGSHLYPVFDVDVPVNLAQRTSRICAEKNQLEIENSRLANEVSLLRSHNSTLKKQIATVEQSNNSLREEQAKLDRDNQNLTHAVTIVNEYREEGDLELLSSDFDFELRLMEIEFAVGIPMNLSRKGVRSMARTPYDMAKVLILGGKYEREEMMIKLDRFEKLGSITAEQKAELIALMDAEELVK